MSNVSGLLLVIHLEYGGWLMALSSRLALAMASARKPARRKKSARGQLEPFRHCLAADIAALGARPCARGEANGGAHGMRQPHDSRRKR